MSDVEKNRCADREPALPHQYGLALFEYDLVAQIVPGMFLLLLTRVLREALSIPQPRWTSCLPVLGDSSIGFISVGAIVLAAYIIGLLADALMGWRVVDKFALKAHKSLRNDGKSWDEAVRLYTEQGTTKNEYIQVYRAHVQARALANMGVLCIALTFGMLLAAAYHHKPWWMLLLLGLGGTLSGTAILYASYWRERRRVLGVHLACKLESKGKPEEKAQKCGKPSCCHWVIWGISVVTLMILVALIVFAHVGSRSPPVDCSQRWTVTSA